MPISHKIGAFILLLLLMGSVVYLLFIIVRSAYRYAYNKLQKIITEKATVYSKKLDVRRPMQNDITSIVTELKSEYITFELENGKRIEFQVPPGQMDKMAEGQKGTLTHQGTKFISYNS